MTHCGIVSDECTVIVRSELDHTSHVLRFDSAHIDSSAIIEKFVSRLHGDHHWDRNVENSECDDDDDDDDDYYVTCSARVLRPGLFLDTDYGIVPSSDRTLFVQLHRCGALRGGKGGFGAQLRAQGTKVGQKKTTNFGACRDLHGRRLRDIRDERRLRQWFTEQETAEREALEQRERERRERYIAERESVMTTHGEAIRKQAEVLQKAVMNGLAEQEKHLSAVKEALAVVGEEAEKKRKRDKLSCDDDDGDDESTNDSSSGSAVSNSSESNGDNKSEISVEDGGKETFVDTDSGEKINKRNKGKKRRKRRTAALFESEFDSGSDSD